MRRFLGRGSRGPILACYAHVHVSPRRHARVCAFAWRATGSALREIDEGASGTRKECVAALVRIIASPFDGECWSRAVPVTWMAAVQDGLTPEKLCIGIPYDAWGCHFATMSPYIFVSMGVAIALAMSVVGAAWYGLAAISLGATSSGAGAGTAVSPSASRDMHTSAVEHTMPYVPLTCHAPCITWQNGQNG